MIFSSCTFGAAHEEYMEELFSSPGFAKTSVEQLMRILYFCIGTEVRYTTPPAPQPPPLVQQQKS